MNFRFTTDAPTHTVASLLPHHDLVFRAPVCDPLFGIPLGNGDTGLLLHLSPDTLHVQINHTDLIDRLDRSNEAHCDDILEYNTASRNGARLDLRFPAPFFESIFTEEFEGRLALADAKATVHTKTPHGTADLCALVSEKYGVGVLSLDLALPEDAPLFADLSRFGSRTLSRWYYLDRRLMTRGTDGTESYAEASTVAVTQRLSDLSFAVAVRAVCDTSPDAKRHGNYKASLSFPDATHHTLRLYIAVGIGGGEQDAKAEAYRKLDCATAVSYDALYEEHRESWERFWSRSYVSLPEEQDYLENLWYLNLYYANCQNRGNYPPHFCNGVWGFHYDFVPWVHYFHYNTQLGTFPLNAADHPELLTTYLRFRRDQLPLAERFCQKIKGVDGAFFTDVCDYDGKMERSVYGNCTCGAQIALIAYKHYLYTGDESFLQTSALPLMERVADFYLAKLEADTDGFYHIYKTQTYEGSPVFDDSLTDHAMMRALFSALLPHTSGERHETIEAHLQNLAPFMSTDFYEGDLAEDGTVAKGLGKGLFPATDSVLATGIFTDEQPGDRDYDARHFEVGKRARRTTVDFDLGYPGFPDIEMAPVYPASLVGVDDRDTELYRQILNSVYMHREARFAEDEGEVMGHKVDTCMGWCLMPIYLARMGLSDLLEKQLRDSAVAWIRYPQGFGIYSHSDRIERTLNDRFYRYRVRDVKDGETYTVPAWNYRHFDYETLPILATATNEMLLQSYGGVLRLFPAVNTERSYAFTLAAEGGFLVRAIYDGGYADAKITARRDATLVLSIYNVKSTPTFARNGTPVFMEEKDGRYTLAMKEGDVLSLKIGDICEIVRNYERNDDVKFCSTSQLGCPKEYTK